MSDVTDAPTQDQVAESLLGEPEETQADAAEVTTAEPEESAEVAEGEPTEQQQVEEESQEAADDWLPTEQEKVFPDDVLLKYAARYGLDEQKLADPLLKQLVVDKINSDIYLRQQQELEEQNQVEEEGEPEPEPTQPTAPPSMQEHFAQLQRVVEQNTDPAVAKAFHDDFMKAFGMSDADIAKMPADQAMKLTTTVSKYMLNLVNTFMPSMLQGQLQSQLGQAFPGFSEMYERSAHAMAWDRVRNSSADYAGLPAYGTKDFTKTLREAASRIPGFDEMVFTGRDGKALSPMDNAERKYAMLAKIASGKNVDPNVIRQAVVAGQKQARKAQVTRQAGNLGSGKSTTAASAASKLADDDPLKEGYDIWQREHGRL